MQTLQEPSPRSDVYRVILESRSTSAVTDLDANSNPRLSRMLAKNLHHETFVVPNIDHISLGRTGPHQTPHQSLAPYITEHYPHSNE